MSDETTPQPRIKITWLIGTGAAFALFAVIGAYSARMTREYPDYDQEQAAKRYVTLAQVRHDEQALISGVAWVDQSKGIVRIPIEEAMARELDTLKSQPAVMGAAIPVIAPPPPAKPVPATGGTNAAPAASGAGPAPATSKPKKSNS
ncbi:MAG TPA: hypothetical protein VGZ93_00145 [Candidatus Methylacidiphilales bacterium]|jgi:hypothetical protein|nr:hypothetical protein [Candidatus Methylacidiphilales bacterium]